MTLPKEHLFDSDIIEKAAAMMRCGHTDQSVSDYLGMIEGQVRDIRRRTRFLKHGRPVSSTELPPIDDDARRRRYAENCTHSSQALARAIGRMGQ